MKLYATFAILALAPTAHAAEAVTATSPHHPAPACTAIAETRQFAFWVGTWNVAPWTPGKFAATGVNHVTEILNGCAILEEWTSASGGKGKSLNFWDTNRLKWRQVWVDQDGGSLDYEGEFRGNAMHFEGWTREANGKRTLQKLTFTRVAADTVRQHFEESPDSGRTWKTTYDLRYVRMRAR